MSLLLEAEVLYDFEAGGENEMPLKKGDIVRVTNSEDAEGWWEGESNGKRGLFPANYVKPLEKNTRPQQTPTAKEVKVQIAETTVKVEKKEPEEKGKGDRGAREGGKAPAAEKDETVTMSATRYGVWASNMAIGASAALFVCGVAVLLWAALNPDAYNWLALFIGFYCVVVSFGVYVFESKRGQFRRKMLIPYRGIIYLILTAPTWFTLPSLYAGIMLALTGLASCFATLKGEFFLVRKSDLEKKAPEQVQSARERSVLAWWQQVKEEDRKGAVIFLFLYVSANIVVWVFFFQDWIKRIDRMPAATRVSQWIAFAKAFGTCIDFNVVCLIIPVCRTVIRWLYDNSTTDHSCFQRFLRAILKYVPLDQSLHFHQLVAWVIVGHAIGHTITHLLNYVVATSITSTRYGIAPFVTGGGIWAVMLLLYSATPANVKWGHFEIFWYTHHLFVFFFVFTIIHGANWIGPNFWKWFVAPGAIYVLERCYREYKSSQHVALVSVTHMLPSVLCVEMGKLGALANYKEGQYIFLNCPYISRTEWHPFTLSSAPQEETCTVHIRVMGKGSWTRNLQEFLKLMGRQGEAHVEFTEARGGGISKGKIYGPDGKRQIFRIYGPHSAPTQHLGEYNTAMVIASGIGVTPLCAALKSIVHHRWRYFMGKTFPDKAYMYWVVAYEEIDSFKWFVRTIKEAEDGIAHIDSKSGAMQNKTYELHIFVTSIPNGVKQEDYRVGPTEKDDVEFWGLKRKGATIEQELSSVSEIQLYRAIKNPTSDLATFGHIQIHKGRPNWDEHFAQVDRNNQEGDVGVCFCGNPRIAIDLQKMCKKYSSPALNKMFRLHKENF